MRSYRLLRGHVLDVLRSLEAGSVYAVITSPPYWGMRDYSRCECELPTPRAGRPRNEHHGINAVPRGGHRPDDILPPSPPKSPPNPACPKCHGTGKDDSLNVVWGGEDCEHRWGEERFKTAGRKDQDRNRRNKDGRNPETQGLVGIPRQENASQGSFCSLCHAWRGQLGLEPTPELYVQHIVEVFREVRRVLRDDGTLWLNMGDCYNSQGGHTKLGETSQRKGRSNIAEQHAVKGANILGLKPKDLVGMPWRVAFALQADGWWLRSDIIWAKPNPMPESVTDRPTRSHEYVFFLTNSGRTQYWTHPFENGTRTRPKPDYWWKHRTTGELRPLSWSPPDESWRKVNVWRGHDYFYDADAVRESVQSGPSDIRKMVEKKDRIGGLVKELTDPLAKASAFTHIGRKRSVGDPSGRNKRTVWEITTQPYPEAHFATFPEKLVEPCIKAGTPEKGACGVCGSPWERVVEAKPNPSKADFDPDSREWANTHQRTSNPQSSKSLHRNPGGVYREAVTTGFRPTCDHDAKTDPALVFDPFCGSGTAGVVALRLGRRFLGIDVKEEYLEMAERRLRRFPVRLDSF